MMDSFLTNKQFFTLNMLIDGLEWCGLLVDYYDVFISCLDSHSDGTHSLQRKHWWARDVMLNFYKSVLTTNQTHLIYILGWPEGEYIFIFGLTILFKNIYIKGAFHTSFFPHSFLSLSMMYVHTQICVYACLVNKTHCLLSSALKQVMSH